MKPKSNYNVVKIRKCANVNILHQNPPSVKKKSKNIQKS